MSHVRVTVKDDNRGLGANSGFIDEDRPTAGLDGLQDLLGRLNGKDSLQLQADERTRAGFRTATYAGKRWGLNTFVSGGFLIGDRLGLPENLESDKQSIETYIMNPGTGQPRDHKRAKIRDGKRKEAHTATGSAGSGLKALRIQGPEPRRTELTGNDTDFGRVKASITADNNTFETETPIQRSERKAHRRSRRAVKVGRRALEEPGPGTSEATVQDCAETARMTHAPQTRRAHEKHVGRQHSIRQKKMSLMDPRALNEVCGCTIPCFITDCHCIDTDDTCVMTLEFTQS